MISFQHSTDLAAKLSAHKSAIAMESSSLASQVKAQFTADATVLCVPTGSGASGLRAVEEFLRVQATQVRIIVHLIVYFK